MDEKNIFHVEIFNYGDKAVVNELLSNGWNLLRITQFTDETISFGQIVLGCSKDVYLQTDSEIFETEDVYEVEDDDLPF